MSLRLLALAPIILAIASPSTVTAQEKKKAQVPAVNTLAIGAEAPDFTLPNVDGKNYSLKDFSEAKAMVLIFTCNHCPDARAARGKMISLHKDYKDKGVAVIAISGNDDKALLLNELGYSVYGDSFDDMKSVAKEEGYQFPYLYDGETQKASTAYGAVATPHTFVFDADKKLRYHGRIDDARRSFKDKGTPYVRQALDAILAGKEVTKTITRAHGCSTKWAWKRGLVAKDNERWKNLPLTLADLDKDAAKALAANDTKKLRIINFWSTTCGPCIAEFPDLIETYRRYEFRPLELITISTDPIGDREKVTTFLKGQQAGLSNRTASSVKKEGRTTNNYIYKGENIDHLGEAIDSEWSGALPHTVIVAPGGKILWRHNGQVDAIELRREIVTNTSSTSTRFTQWIKNTIHSYFLNFANGGH